MHSIFGFMQRGKGSPAQGPGVSDRRAPVYDSWASRPEMSAGTARTVLGERDMRKAGKPRGKVVAADPRDTPKYGVTGTRPYSTKSQHGTGRGSQV